MDMQYEFTTKTWVSHGDKSSWFFVTLPQENADHIKFFTEDTTTRRGFGSVRVVARVGHTEWKTSIFPSKEDNSYILPLKAQVRKAEDISQGQDITVHINVLVD